MASVTSFNARSSAARMRFSFPSDIRKPPCQRTLDAKIPKFNGFNLRLSPDMEESGFR
jgi:hypothetical protein